MYYDIWYSILLLCDPWDLANIAICNKFMYDIFNSSIFRRDYTLRRWNLLNIDYKSERDFLILCKSENFIRKMTRVSYTKYIKTFSLYT